MSSQVSKSNSGAGSIAICGNPNCGKTTIFNGITGLSQHVGNYPGVTVEKVVGQFSYPNNSKTKHALVDIPGTYSLSAFTPDEYIAASTIFGEISAELKPDVLIAVLDATNLERSLYLLLQIMQSGCPIVVALNMIDLAERRGIFIDTELLSKKLGGLEVVEVVGNKGKGIEKLKEKTAELIGLDHKTVPRQFDDDTEDLIDELTEKFGNRHRTKAQYLRIIFDENGPAEQKFFQREGAVARDIISNGREKIRKRFGSLSMAETGWLTEKSTEIFNDVITSKPKRSRTRSERIDNFVLHPVLGPIMLSALMVFMFQSIFSWSEPFMNLIDSMFSSMAFQVEGLMIEGPLRSLITDGIIGGVGSVLIFIPQIAVLFIFIALMEDSGYMPRAAFLVDRMFRWCGLSGKSFIPMLSSFACAVPGIMATRTIEDKKQRIITVMVAPLMTCSARLPVYAIMIAAFIPYQSYLGLFNLQGLVLTALYLLGLVVAVIVAFILKKTILKTERGTFMMEMPSYKIPTFKSVAIRVINRLKEFIVRAGTVIMAITIIIWALSYYPRSEDLIITTEARQAALSQSHNNEITIFTEQLNELETSTDFSEAALLDISTQAKDIKSIDAIKAVQTSLIRSYPDYGEVINYYLVMKRLALNYENASADLANNAAGIQIRNSYFGIIGQKIEPLFLPLGWDWKITMSVMASFPAREVIIAVLGTIYNLGTEVDEESSSLVEKMRQAKWEDGDKIGQPVFTPAVAISIMIFFALCCQCGATLVTIKQETNSWWYPAATFTYMTTLAYLLSFVAYQMISRIGGL